jgi:1-aminocyclopropane-1-carboxylate deaminase/D-cysteine desulfhydrase-like pyridoxal-dependent ACC family enzyme
MERIGEEERNQGRFPYLVPVGGSRIGGNMQQPLGAVAYTQAFIEIYTQSRKQGLPLHHVVVATGSGGTQAGLVVGAKALAPEVKIVGISISGRKAAIQENVAAIANATAGTLGLELNFDAEEVIVYDDYVGEGYGIMYPEAADAITTVARNEGILLDPVYTSKAMFGMVDLIKKKNMKQGEGAVFIHTGGTPALFPYKDKLMKLIEQI